MRYFYSLLFYLVMPLVLVRLWWKGRKTPGYRERWPERFGFVNPLPEGCIWVHAVSVGEMITAKPLIQALQKRYPELTLVITNMTATGANLAKQLSSNRLQCCYVPYDVPSAVQRFLRRVKPKLAIIMETELWPNIIHYTAQSHIPILLANARLSERSFQRYRRILPLVRPMLASIPLIAVQTAEEAKRFIELGANPDQVKVAGSIKFDVPVPADLIQKGDLWRQSWGEKRPTVIAASTHNGEEEKVLSAFAELRKTWPTALLILVPRHQERFDQVATLCEKQGYTILRRSQNQPCTPDTQILIGDSLGELFMYYAAADIAFVGGSFVPVGGHNLLEPAALGLPILTGSYLFNFTEISKLLQNAGALLIVPDEIQLAREWSSLLQDAPRCQAMGEKAQQVVEKNRGALAKHLEFAADLLGSP